MSNKKMLYDVIDGVASVQFPPLSQKLTYALTLRSLLTFIFIFIAFVWRLWWSFLWCISGTKFCKYW